ncbi:GntR-family transcriptional regulator [Streptomyces hygroscopicus subsp. jinggangensis 5008]|nr:GntR-family transcriptional regulator [Streptomyces hygroscopicus subsp. jinggangensis 5008]AGF62770.1 GntR-family transcriptional regulator [Streptomyces hygroscopicus subsp. jinggangensis TL01]
MPAGAAWQYVLDAIGHRIPTGQLTPGQAPVETEPAARFGVPKTPVREALKTLAGTGLVAMSQYAVARAADPSWEREAAGHREILRLALALALALDGDPDGAAGALHAHIASFVRRAFPEPRPEEGRRRAA